MFRTLPTLSSTSWAIVTALTLQLFISSGCVKREFNQQALTHANASPSSPEVLASRININTASADELEKLPGIGMGLAERIIEHREKFGPFRRPEHLIMVRGISDKRFRALQNLITVK